MPTSLLLRDCFGFHKDAISRWESLIYGIDQSGVQPKDDWMDSCSICFDSDDSPQNIAFLGSRAMHLVNMKLPLNHTQSSHFVCLLKSTESLGSPAFCMDLLGGFLFRDASKVSIVPPIEDLSEFLGKLPTSLSVSLSHALVRRAFGSTEAANAFFQKAFTAILIRDSLRVLESEKQLPLPTASAQSILSSVCGISLSSDYTEVLTEFVNDLRPDLSDTSFRSEWESVVSALYNRPKAPRGLKILPVNITVKTSPEVATPSSKRTGRRMNKRSYRDLLKGGLEDSDDEEIVIGRTSRKKAPATSQEELVLQIDNWLQCDSCSKWRLVDANTVSAFQDKTFTCANLPGKTCLDPSDY